jgi:hypothetical protein
VKFFVTALDNVSVMLGLVPGIHVLTAIQQ